MVNLWLICDPILAQDYNTNHTFCLSSPNALTFYKFTLCLGLLLHVCFHHTYVQMSLHPCHC